MSYIKQINVGGYDYDLMPMTHTHSASDITDMTSGFRQVKVNNNSLVESDDPTAINLQQASAGFATVSGSGGTITFDTKFRKVSSLSEATDTSCVYLIPSTNGNVQQPYIIASSAPSDKTKIWIDSANSNIAKVWTGSAWSTLGAVWS